MRKFRIILLTAAVICGLLTPALTGCASRRTNALERVQTAGVLTALVPENAGIYAYTLADGVTWEGTEIELARAIAESIGAELRVIAYPKTELLYSLAQGLGDIAIGRIAENSSLLYNYAVSKPYGEGRLYAVTPRGVLFPTGGALAGMAVGYTDQLSENALIALHQIPDVKVTVYGETTLVEDTLSKGLAAAYLCYEEQAFALANVDSLQAQNIALGEKENYVIISSKGGASLIAAVNAVIDQRAAAAAEAAAAEAAAQAAAADETGASGAATPAQPAAGGGAGTGLPPLPPSAPGQGP
ncbi:MAG: transporter substrate-binding domain-containing protein [Peptococcaceae bacterium]|jgi:polar amino acid transport system substrate-binding protein|nr:transporter substrate-binding domain-containing protein [Peptococcaceae bacterium]